MTSRIIPENVTTALAERKAKRAANSARKQVESDKLKLQGNEAFKRGDYLAACDFYVQAMRIQGPKPVLMSNISAAYLQLELYEEAEWAANEAVRGEPTMIKARFRRGLARKNLGYLLSAIIDFHYILDRDSTLLEVRKELQASQRLGVTAAEHVVEDNKRVVEAARFANEPGVEFPSDSDSSEFTQVGNGRPCPSYNHAGCDRGAECHFSHAPDDRSVRDDLGKNVCAAKLVGACRHPDDECPYSHDLTYLPGLSARSDDSQNAQRTLSQSGLQRMPLQAQPPPGQRPFLSFVDKLNALHARATEKVSSKAASVVTNRIDSFVLFISLDHADWHDEIWCGTYSAIRSKAKVVEAKNALDALRLLDDPQLAGVYVGDAGIGKRKNKRVVSAILDYVKAGGIVAIGGVFSSFMTMPEVDNFFRALGLPWTNGDYTRETFQLNPTNSLAEKNPHLPVSFSMKALHLANVAPEMAMYHADGGSHVGNFVQSPAVTTTIGGGRLSYLGDVNAEQGSTNVILAMLGLLDAPHEPLQGSVVKRQIAASVVYQDGSDSLPSGSAPTSRHLDGSDNHGFGTGGSSIIPRSLPKPDPNRIILFLNFDNPQVMENVYKNFLSELRSKVKVVHGGLSNSEVLHLLGSKDLLGVFVIDSSINKPENKTVLSRLTTYVKSGGVAVFGGLAEAMKAPFFKTHFGVPWAPAPGFDGDLRINPKHALVGKTDSLSPAFVLEVDAASFMKGVQPAASLYDIAFEANDVRRSRPYQTCFAHAPVGKGHLGYIGSWVIDEDVRQVFYAMMGMS